MPLEEPELTSGAGDLPEEAFRLIVDNSGGPFAVIARDGTILYAGATMERVSGWRPDQLVGRNMVEFLAPHEIEAAIEVVAEIDSRDRSGGGIPMVFELLRPDGAPTWVEVAALPLLDHPGLDAIVLRHRSWSAQHHRDAFVRSLLAAEPLADALVWLARSIAFEVDADAVVIHHGFDGQQLLEGIGRCADGSQPPAETITTDGEPWVRVATSGAPLALEVTDLPEPLPAMARDRGWSALWVWPVPVSEGLAPAVVSVWRARPGGPLAGHRQALDRTGRYVQLAIVRTAEHQQLRHLAGHDALTGVANRTEFRDQLASALAIGERNLAVAFCDLDGFKAVNDTFGHPAGDAVLIEVAERLRASLRVGDSLARMGGDEFTVLCRNVPDASAAHHVAERLQAALRDPIRLGGIDAVVGVSVGMALAEPGVTADTLIARADEVLYRAKRGGGPRSGVWGEPSER